MAQNILFLCTGNSARSILAEAIMNKLGGGRYRAYSAGSHPKGQVHPQALALLRQLGYPTVSLRSKSWDEFAAPGAPVMDYIITVCDQAAGELCPFWPGPLAAHWGMPDPAAATDADQAAAFTSTHDVLTARIGYFLRESLQSLGPEDLKRAMRDAAKVGNV